MAGHLRLHREGRLIVNLSLILIAATITLSIIFLLAWVTVLIASISVLLLILILRFFRDPSRSIPRDQSLIYAPADGTVVAIEGAHEGEYFKHECRVISIFMSIHDVHLNRIPVTGSVKYLKHHPGKYLLARNPKSSEFNERYTTVISHPNGGDLLIRQVAGYVARRIRCYLKEGQSVKSGDELGFIKFGSRVDLYLPLEASVNVKIGEKVKAGITPLARW